MESFLASLVKDTRIGPYAVYRGVAPARPARWAEPAVAWPAGAREALDALGIDRLYAHQAEALELAVRGRNVLLATPTASGKTLAYLLAFLAARQRDPGARAIFLYPLKALARDQLAVVRRVLAPLGYSAAEAAEVYDGDTPEALRRRIRRAPPAVILTNPDMLHLGILPSHDTWGGFLAQLGLVVVDEAHVYRGIFGAHVHHTLRRLLRLARHHGAHPLVMAGSATIGEPQAFVETLTGEPFAAIRDSGAPAALRHVLFLDPRGESPYTIATRVVGEAVAAGHKTIAFTKARRITELMHQWLRQQRPELMPRIASYRSGYLPEERREIERRLFAGELTGVISTSALEAGIDVGGLDVCVLVGYPGSLANAWQRIGRTGRQDRESLAVLIALPDALDHYVTRHPEHFFSGEFERVVLDPENDSIADAHLEAAAAERSIDAADVIQLQGERGMERVQRPGRGREAGRGRRRRALVRAAPPAAAGHRAAQRRDRVRAEAARRPRNRLDGRGARLVRGTPGRDLPARRPDLPRAVARARDADDHARAGRGRLLHPGLRAEGDRDPRDVRGAGDRRRAPGVGPGARHDLHRGLRQAPPVRAGGDQPPPARRAAAGPGDGFVLGRLPGGAAAAPGGGRVPPGGVAARRRARLDRTLPAARDLRPLGPRRDLLRPPPAVRPPGDLRLRRLAGRRRPGAHRLRARGGTVRADPRADRGLPVRGRLPGLRPLAQVRLGQHPARQAGRARRARRGDGRGRAGRGPAAGRRAGLGAGDASHEGPRRRARRRRASGRLLRRCARQRGRRGHRS